MLASKRPFTRESLRRRAAARGAARCRASPVWTNHKALSYVTCSSSYEYAVIVQFTVTCQSDKLHCQLDYTGWGKPQNYLISLLASIGAACSLFLF